jgi:hypothetical protein
MKPTGAEKQNQKKVKRRAIKTKQKKGGKQKSILICHVEMVLIDLVPENLQFIT